MLVEADTRLSVDHLELISCQTPPQDSPAIDEEWEEAPVSFTVGGAHEMGGPTGVVAKIRASNRSANRKAGS